MWPIVFMISTGLAAAGFVVVAVLWLKKLRETLATALGETANQHIKSTQRLGEAITRLQRHQQTQDERLQILAEANLRLRQELNEMAGRLELMSESEPDTRPPSRMVH